MSKHRRNGEAINPSRPYAELRNVSVAAGSNVLLHSVSLSVYSGEVVRLDGPNGAGKSTVLRTLETVEPIGTPDVSGGVYLFDRDMARMSDRARQRLIGNYVGIGFQSPEPANGVRVYQHLTGLVDMLGISVSDSRVDEVADMFGLTEKMSAYVAPLSGGEKQRLDLARVALKEPKLWLLDEPTSAIDSTSKDMVYGTIRSLCVNDGAAAVIVSHDVQVVNYVDRTLQLQDGSLVGAY